MAGKLGVEIHNIGELICEEYNVFLTEYNMLWKSVSFDVSTYPSLQYKMEASFLEIYNETLRDLLAPSSSSANSQIDVKLDPSRHGEVYVTNVTPCVVTSVEQVCDEELIVYLCCSTI